MMPHSVRRYKIISLILASILIASILSACLGGGITPDSTTATSGGEAPAGETQTGSDDVKANVNPVIAVAYDSADQDDSWTGDAVTSLSLSDETIRIDGAGAVSKDGIITITAAGTYLISGSLSNGQIIVNAQDGDLVMLILNGVSLTCLTSAPIYIVNADKVVLVLAEGTVNAIADGPDYILANTEENEPNAAIFSTCDLTINGAGVLNVTANYNHAIACKDGFKIMGGTINIEAAADGIRGKDYTAVKGGTVTITAAGDGIRAGNAEDAGKGFVAIEGGTIIITAGQDGIQAETSALVSGGDLTIISGGGSVNSSAKNGGWGQWNSGKNTDSASTEISAKGIKAIIDLTITGGTIAIDSSDDALHSNGSLSISEAGIILSAGDDGIHADASIEITSGILTINQSYEGIESASITVGGGDIRILAGDDGINIAGGNDGSSVNGRPGQNSFTSSGDNKLVINGGTIVVDAIGDGLDINGSIIMTGGSVNINGPTNDGNGAIDYDGTFSLTGGFLVAAGSAGMAQAPDASSTQYVLMLNFTATLAAGTLIHIETQAGEDVLTFAPSKDYQSVVFSSAAIKKGETYLVYAGGSTSGTAVDGLTIAGTYAGGTQVTSLTASGVITTFGSVGGRMNGGGRR